MEIYDYEHKYEDNLLPMFIQSYNVKKLLYTMMYGVKQMLLLSKK
jgi:hypothetical protein